MDPTDGELRDICRLAESLSFPTDEALLTEGLAATPSIHEGVEGATRSESPGERSSVGRRSDDEYNALLDIYATPWSGDGTGVLDGVSVAIKDNIAVADLAMTAGLSDFSFVPSFDATVVDRLLDSGATLVGKANMDAFAFGPTGEFSDHGPVSNPVAKGVIPGGSSSGSAAAVAAGLVDAAIGTDTGGSVRQPAGCCDLVGVKPTHRLVPRHGLMDLAPSTDTIGPIARDVETAANVLDTISRYSRTDPSSSRVDVHAAADVVDDAPEVCVGVPREFLAVSRGAIVDVVELCSAELESLERVDVVSR